jgi:hypothetical protein
MPSTYRHLYLIYIDEFQPFHIENKKLFDTVNSKNPTRSFINLVGFNNTNDLPFSYEETQTFLNFFAIPENKILVTRNKHNISEIKNEFIRKKIPFDSTQDAIIFVESVEDYDPKRMYEKDSYIKSYQFSKNNIQPANKHAYILYSGSDSLHIGDKSLDDVHDIRKLYSILSTDQQKKQFVKRMYGAYDQTIYDIVNDELSGTVHTIHPDKKDSKKDKKLELPPTRKDRVVDKPDQEPDATTVVKDVPTTDKSSKDTDKLKEYIKKYLKENESSISDLFQDPNKFKATLKQNVDALKKAQDELKK